MLVLFEKELQGNLKYFTSTCSGDYQSDNAMHKIGTNANAFSSGAQINYQPQNQCVPG